VIVRAAIAAVLLLALPAHAEGEKAQAPAGAKAEAAAKGSSSGKQKKVLRLEEFTVEGRIQKPQAFFILQRGTIQFDGGEKKESFLPKIQKSCEKDPF
jgi:hypothetical protein